MPAKANLLYDTNCMDIYLQTSEHEKLMTSLQVSLDFLS